MNPNAATSAVMRFERSRSSALAHGRVERAPAIAQMVDVGDEHDAVQHGDPEQRDKPHRRAEVQVQPPQPQRPNAAHQRERHVEHHEERLPRVPKARIQEADDQEQDERDDQHEPLHGPFLILELPAIGHEIALGQRDAPRYGALHLPPTGRDRAAQRSSA